MQCLSIMLRDSMENTRSSAYRWRLSWNLKLVITPSKYNPMWFNCWLVLRYIYLLQYILYSNLSIKPWHRNSTVNSQLEYCKYSSCYLRSALFLYLLNKAGAVQRNMSGFCYHILFRSLYSIWSRNQTIIMPLHNSVYGLLQLLSSRGWNWSEGAIILYEEAIILYEEDCNYTANRIPSIMTY